MYVLNPKTIELLYYDSKIEIQNYQFVRLHINIEEIRLLKALFFSISANSHYQNVRF